MAHHPQPESAHFWSSFANLHEAHPGLMVCSFAVDVLNANWEILRLRPEGERSILHLLLFSGQIRDFLGHARRDGHVDHLRMTATHARIGRIGIVDP
jgi:hypothetical protein